MSKGPVRPTAASRARDHLGRDRLGADETPDDPAAASGRRRLPEALDGPLGEVVRARGWAPRLEGARVHEVWDRVAGAELAQHVRPLRLYGGVLVLSATSSVWATQVRYLTGDLAARLNEALGSDLVEQVRVTTGGGDETRQDHRR